MANHENELRKDDLQHVLWAIDQFSDEENLKSDSSG
jgi:hypothetical protein